MSERNIVLSTGWGRVRVAVVLAWCLGVLGAMATARADEFSPFLGLHFADGPMNASLGSIAQLQVPKSYRFLDSQGAAEFLRITHNIPTGRELGVVMPSHEAMKDPKNQWFMLFSYEEIGYVKDDEKDNLNDQTADTLLDNFRKGTEQDNIMRKQKGWAPLVIDGWEQKPFYDNVTNNLTWAVRTKGEEGTGVNYDSRVLGRRGVMQVKMVVSPDALASSLPAYRNMVQGLSYNAGLRYSEVQPGDPIAKYGLIALIGGGAAVVVAKSWKLIAKLGAFLVAGIAAVFRKIKNFFTGGTSAPARSPVAVGAGAMVGARAYSAPAAPSGPAGPIAAGATSVLVRCGSCQKMNRIPSALSGQSPRCGGCGAALS